MLPAIWEAKTFLGKIGVKKEAQMWTFPDRKARNICLVPEATGMVQELWTTDWSRRMSKPARLFYVARCYRYERPQRGRYREFTQFGIEMLGAPEAVSRGETLDLLAKCLDATGVDYRLKDGIRRGIGYYVEAGFEAECPSLGAQKQVAGGGRYPEGVGWAVGIDRLLLARYGD